MRSFVSDNSELCTKEIELYFGSKNIFYLKVNLNPMIVIDNIIIWYGVPFSSANFILKTGRYDVNYRPIFRFVGERTVRVLHYLIGK